MSTCQAADGTRGQSGRLSGECAEQQHRQPRGAHPAAALEGGANVIHGGGEGDVGHKQLQHVCPRGHGSEQGRECEGVEQGKSGGAACFAHGLTACRQTASRAAARRHSCRLTLVAARRRLLLAHVVWAVALLVLAPAGWVGVELSWEARGGLSKPGARSLLPESRARVAGSRMLHACGAVRAAAHRRRLASLSLYFATICSRMPSHTYTSSAFRRGQQRHSPAGERGAASGAGGAHGNPGSGRLGASTRAQAGGLTQGAHGRLRLLLLAERHQAAALHTRVEREQRQPQRSARHACLHARSRGAPGGQAAAEIASQKRQPLPQHTAKRLLPCGRWRRGRA